MDQLYVFGSIRSGSTFLYDVMRYLEKETKSFEVLNDGEMNDAPYSPEM